MQPIKCFTYSLCLGAAVLTAALAQAVDSIQQKPARGTELRLALAPFASWAKAYATKVSGTAELTKVEEGVVLAKQRRAALAQLMQNDPAAALAASLPEQLRKNLPVAVQNELEVPVFGTGDFLVLCAMPVQGARATEGLQRKVRLNGRIYHASVYGRRLAESTKFHIPLHGIALNGTLALDEKVLAELQPEEAAAETNSITDLSAAAGPLAGPGPAVLARMEDKVYRFASAEHLRKSEALLEAAEESPRPEPEQPAYALLEGARFPEAEVKATRHPRIALPGGPTETKVLVVRADFSDLPGDPHSIYGSGSAYTASWVQTVADAEVASYYQNSSYGRATLSFTVAPQLYRLPGTAAFYAKTGYEFQLYDDAITAAKADYTVTNFDKVIVLFSWLGNLPGSQIQFGGLSVVGTSMVWVNGEFDFRVVAHELGHTFGLYHANFWHTSDGNPISDNGSSTEYGDPFDTMSSNWGNDRRVDFNPWFKYLINWIHADQVQTVTDSGIYRVYRFDDPHASGTLALKVAKDSLRDYWIGFRRNFAENQGLQHGAYVVWGYQAARQSNLQGLGPAVNTSRDPGLALGSVLADTKANLTILPVAQGGEAPNEYLDLQITFGPPPAIAQQPESQVTLEGENAQFVVQATGNPDFVWQRRAAGTADWITLADGQGYSGTRASVLLVSPATQAMTGDSFRCLLTNPSGGLNCTRPVELTVNVFGVGTIAGQPGLSGQADGAGRLAQFNSPMGVALDSAGNAYVADSGNHVIRKISRAGVVSTLAGLAGNPGSADGVGGAARFNAPAAVAVDGAGMVYVADQLNSTIRRITPDGMVTTVAGLAGSIGSADGVGAAAAFSYPGGVAADCFGNLYVADTGNNTIRVINSEGMVSTLAGASGVAGAADGTGSEARFASPTGIALDSAGNLYIADQGNFTVRVIAANGVVSTLAGLAGVSGSVDGAGADARFSLPAAVAVDLAGNAYVADRTNSSIREVSPTGIVTTLAGTAGTNGIADGLCSSAQFTSPVGLAVDAQGLIYVADTSANTIRLIRNGAPPIPVLRMSVVAGRLLLSWPAAATGFALETRSDLSAAGSWAPVASQPVLAGCNLVLTNDPAAPIGFFRLHTQPRQVN